MPAKVSNDMTHGLNCQYGVKVNLEYTEKHYKTESKRWILLEILCTSTISKEDDNVNEI